MKKITVLCALIVSLASCHNSSNETTIRGEIKGLANDTIYLYGTAGSYEKIDTIIAKDGKIEHTLKIDTTAQVLLLFNHQTEIPLFLNKEEEIRIQGNANALDFLTVEGNAENEAYTAFQQTLKGLGKPSEKMLEKKITEFIHKHPSSVVSIYLMNRYFAQKPQPDYNAIKSFIALMPGSLQDYPVIGQIKEDIDRVEAASKEHTAPFFSLTNTKGEKITRTGKYKDKYLLIHFWASWDEPSKKANAELRKISRNYKTNKQFGLLGISLDVDKAAWKEAIKRDTLSWEQVCDFKGLNSETVGQYGVLALPANVLIEPSGQIVARDVKEKELKQLIKKNDAD